MGTRNRGSGSHPSLIGRWLISRMLEIHVQEVAAVRLWISLPPAVYQRVAAFALGFGDALAEAKGGAGTEEL